VEEELAPLDRVVQAGDQIELLTWSEAHGRTVHKMCAAGRAIRVHMRRLQDVLPGGSLRREDADSRPGAQVDLVPRVHERPPQDVPHLSPEGRGHLGDVGRVRVGLRRGVVGHVGQEHDELVPAVAGDDRRRAGCVAQPVGELTQHGVSDRVAVAVVHEAEVLEGHEDDADGTAPPACSHDGLGEAPREDGAVGKARQLVVVAQEREPLLRLASLRDVLADAVHADDLAGGVAAHAVPPRDDALAAAPRPEAFLGAVLEVVVAHGLEEAVLVLDRPDGLVPAAPDELVARPARDVAHVVVAERDDAVEVELDRQQLHALEGVAVAALGLAQVGLRLLSGAHVLEEALGVKRSAGVVVHDHGPVAHPPNAPVLRDEPELLLPRRLVGVPFPHGVEHPAVVGVKDRRKPLRVALHLLTGVSGERLDRRAHVARRRRVVERTRVDGERDLLDERAVPGLGASQLGEQAAALAAGDRRPPGEASQRDHGRDLAKGLLGPAMHEGEHEQHHDANDGAP
jgi:hypothetical protein